MFKFEFNLKHKLDVIDGLTWNIKDIAEPGLFACAFSYGHMNFNFCNLTFHIAIIKFFKNRTMFNGNIIKKSDSTSGCPKKRPSVAFHSKSRQRPWNGF